MGPDTQTMNTSTTITGSNFFNVPQLAEDGLNWIIYKGRLLTAVNARGSTMGQYLDGSVQEPTLLQTDSNGVPIGPAGGAATPAEIKENLNEIQEYQYRNSIVKQQIFSTLTDDTFLRVQEFESASKIWMELCAIHEGKTKLTQIDLRRQLHETRCQEGGDVKEHFSALRRLKQSLAGMGVKVADEDYTAIIMGSLPESYRPTLSAISANARMNAKSITPNDLIQVITEEYEHRQLTGKLPTKRGGNSALTARSDNRRAGNSGTRKNSANSASADVECYNCHRKGHYKLDCWRRGGGKEGQKPQRQGRNDAAQPKQSASSASTTAPQEDFAFASMAVIPNSPEAIIDSGATSHFCPDRSKFITFSDIPVQDVRTANGTTISAVGQGDIKIDLPLGDKTTRVTLKNVLYTPKMSLTLISANRITAAGFTVQLEENLCRIISPAPHKKTIAEIPHTNGLYVIPTPITHQAHTAHERLSLHALHRILGHIAQPAVSHAVKNGLIEGVTLDLTSTPEFCDACTKAKAARQPFPDESRNRARLYGELVHTDLWGPAQTTSIGGSLYYISFTDDYSRETQVRFLRQKSDALQAFKHYMAEMTHQHAGVKLRKLRSDRGGEYLSAEFDKYLKDNGIKRQLTIHDSPQQNGVAERLNRTLVEHARAMILGRNMPMFLWPEAVNYATWLKNRLPSRAIPGETPYSLVHKTKPNLSRAREFGGKLYVHSTAGGKLEARAEEAVFVGIDEESKGYRVYWPEKRRVSIERNVTFVPMTTNIETDGLDVGESVPVSTPQNIQPTLPSDQAPPDPPVTPLRPSQPLPQPTTPRPTRVRPPAGYYRDLEQGRVELAAMADNLLESNLHWALATAEPEPTLKEALTGPDAEEWYDALDYEIGQLEKLGAWEIVKPPPRVNIIPSHYVLVTKRGLNREKLKLRARLVANGQHQKYGLDYSETFAPTTNMSTIRVILTMAVRQNWEIHQVDIKSAYLNAELHEDIYMRAPPGYLKPEDEGKVLKLRRSLYGLKQAGHEWSEELEKFFLGNGFTRSQVDQAVYFRRSDEEHTVVSVSVDDMAITSKHLQHVLAFKAKLRGRFEISDLGELNWLLGLKVDRNRQARTITLSQKAYVDTILERF